MERDADTRHGHAGKRPCTDANEPQYTGVIFLQQLPSQVVDEQLSNATKSHQLSSSCFAPTPPWQVLLHRLSKKHRLCLQLDSQLRLLVFQVLVNLLSVEVLDHVRFFDNLRCVTVAPTTSGFSRTLFFFTYLEKNLMFMQHMATLTTQSFSCFGPNHLCHASFIYFHSSFISILNTLKTLASSQFHIFLKILSQPDWRHLSPVFGILGLRFWNCWS